MAPLKGSHLYRGNVKLSKITEDLILEARRKIFLIGKARLTTICMLIDSVCMRISFLRTIIICLFFIEIPASNAEIMKYLSLLDGNFSFFSLAESPPRELQITAYK